MKNVLLIIIMIVCSGCGVFGPRELSDKEFIKVVNKAGCVLKQISRDDGIVDAIVCQDVVEYLR